MPHGQVWWQSRQAVKPMTDPKTLDTWWSTTRWRIALWFMRQAFMIAPRGTAWNRLFIRHMAWVMECKEAWKNVMDDDRTCPHTAAYRYTWPGSDESFICTEHVGKLRAVATAMGCYVQIIPLDTPQEDRPKCCQRVS